MATFALNYTGTEINTRLGYITQNLSVAASPTFAGLTLSGLTASKILTLNASKNINASILYYNNSENLIFGNSQATSQDYNTAVGRYTLNNMTSAQRNSALGRSSLTNLTDGSYNIGIGMYAGAYYGVSTAANQSSNQSVYLGYTSRASANGNTNEIVIGANSLGNGTNTVTLGNSSVTGWYKDSTLWVNQALASTSSPTFANLTITAGANFSGTITNLTIVNGIVTAAS